MFRYRSAARVAHALTKGAQQPKSWTTNAQFVPLVGSRAFSGFGFSFCDSPASSDAGAAPATTPVAENITVAIDNAVAAVEPAVAHVLGNAPSHLVMKAIDLLHTTLDIPYWGSIIASTLILRTFLLPITISGIQNSARLQCMKPEMERIQKAFTSDPMHGDIRAKKKYEEEMKGLFKKFNCNPIRSLSMPLLQVPIFMSFFFALKEMGLYFPDMANGGALWFTDLTIPDASYMLPVLNAVSFLAMLELTTASNNNVPNKQLMKNVMRFFAIALIPMTIEMPQAVFMYWSANSTFSVVQMMVLKTKAVKKYLDIPDPPAEDPATQQQTKIENPFKNIMEVSFLLMHFPRSTLFLHLFFHSTNVFIIFQIFFKYKDG